MHETENEPVTCQMCGMEFASKAELDAHNKEAHGMDTSDEE